MNTGNPPVEKPNGSRHFVWENSENRGCDSRRFNFSIFSGLFTRFGYNLWRVVVPLGQILQFYVYAQDFSNRLVSVNGKHPTIQRQELKVFSRRRPALLFIRNVSEFLNRSIPNPNPPPPPPLLLDNQLELSKFGKKKLRKPIKWHQWSRITTEKGQPLNLVELENYRTFTKYLLD